MHLLLDCPAVLGTAEEILIVLYRRNLCLFIYFFKVLGVEGQQLGTKDKLLCGKPHCDLGIVKFLAK